MADTQLPPQQNISTQHPQQPPQAVKPDAQKIHLTVRNRIKVLFSDDIAALTTTNDTGIFDVLPEHANLISLINSNLIVHKLDGSQLVLPLKNGLLKVKDSAIHCYVDLLAAEEPQQAAQQKGITPPGNNKR